jgi:hypothetical protein
MKILTFESYDIIDSVRKDFNDYYYYFRSANHDYQVRITEFNNSKYYSVGFRAKTDNEYFYDMSIIVNENPYKLMETIIGICEKFIDDLNEKITEVNNKIKVNMSIDDIFKGFVFSFTGNLQKNYQRLQLYKRYIPNDWKISFSGNKYIITKNI